MLRTILVSSLAACCLGGPALAAVPQQTVLHSFAGGTADGTAPDIGVVADKTGNLYGTTQYGGAAGNGTVFQLSPPSTKGDAWTETVLYSFMGGLDGYTPYAAKK